MVTASNPMLAAASTSQTHSHVGPPERPGLEHQRHDAVAKGHERHHRGDDERRHPLQPRLQALPGPFHRLLARPDLARHLRQLGVGVGHPEHRHRQHVEVLHVAERRDGARPEEAGDDVVDVGGHLVDTPPPEGREEVAQHRPDVGRGQAEADTQPPEQANRTRQLHPELQGAAHDSAAGEDHGQLIRTSPVGEEDQGGNHGGVPQHRGHVGQEHAAMAS